jgi:CheY-like chemotaxis protein
VHTIERSRRLSLNGNLEDLPLLDILQIVSFSKKTGYLAIRAPAGEGAIVFRDGFVVSSFAWDAPPLDPRFMNLSEGQRASVIRTRIEISLETLIRLREGHFSFSLAEAPPPVVGGRDLSRETLSVGINPQELLLDLARGIDEDRRDSQAAVEDSFAEAGAPPRLDEFRRTEGDPGTQPVPIAERGPAPPPAAAPAPPSPASADATVTRLPHPRATLQPVDDEEDIRRVLTLVFQEAGYPVAAAEDPEVAVKTAAKLGKDGVPFILVTDLGMPTSGGSSFHGGFEIVKRLWKMNLRPPVLMMTESLSPALQLRARQMKIGRFVFKPGLSRLNPRQFEADLLTFGQRLVVEALPRLEAALHAPPAPPPAQKAEGAPATAGEPTSAGADDLSRQFKVLQRRLSELRRPTEAREISLLVMKVAREYFERAVLFLVRHEELKGLGGFGPAPKGHTLNALAREIVVSLAEPSVFRDVVVGAQRYAGPLPEARACAYLMGKIGRFQSAHVALLPLVTHRETIAVLFGDNPETGRPTSNLDALEVFVNQAGVAFENAFLQRKIQNLQGQAG